MATGKPRFTITLEQDLLDKIEDFRFKNRYASRSEAIYALLNKGLEYYKQHPEDIPRK